MSHSGIDWSQYEVRVIGPVGDEPRDHAPESNPGTQLVIAVIAFVIGYWLAGKWER